MRGRATLGVTLAIILWAPHASSAPNRYGCKTIPASADAPISIDCRMDCRKPQARLTVRGLIAAGMTPKNANGIVEARQAIRRKYCAR